MKLFTLIFVSTLCSCGNSFDKVMCGQPEREQKAFIDSINYKYSDKLTITHVPCYADYMKVNLKSNYQKELIDSLQKSYKKLFHWAEFQVYDKDGKLIKGSTGSM